MIRADSGWRAVCALEIAGQHALAVALANLLGTREVRGAAREVAARTGTSFDDVIAAASAAAAAMGEGDS